MIETSPSDTVTISLHTYEQMQERIRVLEKENQEKTIYKPCIHTTFAFVFTFVIIAFMFYILSI